MNDARARELDDAFLGIVANWAAGGPGCDEARFDELARATCGYQLERNAPYARYAATFGIDPAHRPRTWREIPAAPASAFKDAVLATCDPREAELIFHTSGTTADVAGRHCIARARLYDAALLAGFDRFILPDRAKLRYLNVVPNPRLRRHSSLGYMMGTVSVLRGDGHAEYLFDEDRGVDAAGFVHAWESAVADAQPVCLAGTAFALVALLDALEANAQRFAAPAGSRIMETGGFKGRARVVERTELYARLETAFGITAASIVGEYGMTELVSQYYDGVESRDSTIRVKRSPPWLRTLVVDAEGRQVNDGEAGFLRHVDLGNRSSVVAIDTEDRGYASGGGIVLLERELDAAPRGCSLVAEDLIARVR
ncbi:MAG: hypothetical protein GIX03_12745 [Candidatus Eremiobacteraeota bacterium]|nr:hypothetical protein [Candidatus Eremiobacteraeota bacterium]MBC5803834.1 hypothetical protein [Candidatus Eremiobacteraeota bacterium]MBC5821776.1 hypothetical protein [Candidatus Eremiobacteraeota bacterium]